MTTTQNDRPGPTPAATPPKLSRYPDKKHNLISFTVTALKEVEVTAALELLHGMYYSDFDNMLKDVGELFIFTPGRSDYIPRKTLRRKSFVFLLDKDDFSDLQVWREINAVYGYRLNTLKRAHLFVRRVFYVPRTLQFY